MSFHNEERDITIHIILYYNICLYNKYYVIYIYYTIQYILCYITIHIILFRHLHWFLSITFLMQPDFVRQKYTLNE